MYEDFFMSKHQISIPNYQLTGNIGAEEYVK